MRAEGVWAAPQRILGSQRKIIPRRLAAGPTNDDLVHPLGEGGGPDLLDELRVAQVDNLRVGADAARSRGDSTRERSVPSTRGWLARLSTCSEGVCVGCVFIWFGRTGPAAKRTFKGLGARPPTLTASPHLTVPKSTARMGWRGSVCACGVGASVEGRESSAESTSASSAKREAERACRQLGSFPDTPPSAFLLGSRDSHRALSDVRAAAAVRRGQARRLARCGLLEMSCQTCCAALID